MLPVIYEFTLPYLLLKSSLWVLEFSDRDCNFHKKIVKLIVFKQKSDLIRNVGPEFIVTCMRPEDC